MNRLERQKNWESLLKGENWEKANEAYHNSGLDEVIKKFKNELPRSFPGLKSCICSTSTWNGTNHVLTGAMVIIEWGRINSEIAKVAKIRIEPNGLLRFGKGKITGRSKITKEEWENDETHVRISEALLKLMNSTSLGYTDKEKILPSALENKYS